MLNPYESFVNGRDPKELIAATPARLAELAPAATKKPAPGRWGVREIICHLADAEVAFAFRLRQALAEDHHVIQPFDQDSWAKNYAAYDQADALEAFKSFRHWNLKLINAQPPAAFDKPVTHPERGAMTFRTLVETMAGHDLNHLRQIEALQ